MSIARRGFQDIQLASGEEYYRGPTILRPPASNLFYQTSWTRKLSGSRLSVRRPLLDHVGSGSLESKNVKAAVSSDNHTHVRKWRKMWNWRCDRPVSTEGRGGSSRRCRSLQSDAAQPLWFRLGVSEGMVLSSVEDLVSIMITLIVTQWSAAIDHPFTHAVISMQLPYELEGEIAVTVNPHTNTCVQGYWVIGDRAENHTSVVRGLAWLDNETPCHPWTPDDRTTCPQVQARYPAVPFANQPLDVACQSIDCELRIANWVKGSERFDRLQSFVVNDARA
ncbi:hypothetical protein BKA82DRAFT_4013097 [Pisolithus tinctorius]|nr:hypothetical protein BKA82DRAFT_4013097 [Pisolithus tinctorius]